MLCSVCEEKTQKTLEILRMQAIYSLVNMGPTGIEYAEKLLSVPQMHRVSVYLVTCLKLEEKEEIR